MASLDELLATLLPGARVVWPPDGFGGEVSPPTIGWVRVMKARVPAFDALDAGDLAIVPVSVLAVVAAEPAQSAAIVDLCRRAKVGAILVVEAEAEGDGGGVTGPVPDPLSALERTVADGGGPVLVRASRADVAALERAVIGFLVNRRAELDRQAAVLEARLEALALEGVGPAAMIGAIAEFLGRPVALEDRRGEPLAVHAPADLPDAAVAVARYHARPPGVRRGSSGPRAAAHRVPLPVAGGPAGSLALLGGRPIAELERVVATRIAGLLALGLARDDAVRRAGDAARRSESLPPGGPPWTVLVARQRAATPRSGGAGGGGGGGGDATAEATTDPVEHREAIRRDLRQLASARRLSLRGDADSLELRLVLAGDTADPEASELAIRVAAFLGRTAAISRPFSAAHDRAAAEAEARATLEAVETLPDPPPLARASRLGAYRLLGSLHHLADGRRQAQALLEPIMAGRSDVRREHLATLRALLDHPGTSEAAEALGVHRNTIAYRVRRIEALTGWPLDDPDLRLALSMALRLVPTD
ncbi:MAG: helix-turn-helix domain-containing protein [Chloroflexota bacterium]